MLFGVFLLQARSLHKRQASGALFRCSFDGSPELCMGRQYENDNFDWKVKSGATPSSQTGPNSAKDGQNYLYIEASSPRRMGDTAM